MTCQVSNARRIIRPLLFRGTFGAYHHFLWRWLLATLRYIPPTRVSHRDLSRAQSRSICSDMESDLKSNFRIVVMGRVSQDMESREKTKSSDPAHTLVHLQRAVESTHRRHAQCCLLRQPHASVGSQNTSQQQQPSSTANSYSFASHCSRIGQTTAYVPTS